ncbi:hypothetical protein [Dankookia sp. P2]|uniref:hypothetical protein n=1 Tax=Dankookia sp. P2 TaxID=3423955 RepID=UPI003D677317
MNAAADAILAARRAKRILAPLGAAAPADPEAGYALQRAVAEAMGAVPPAGFKIGATTQQMQDYLGLTGPAAGFVPQASLHTDGAEFRFADFLNPGVECEIGVRLGRDLPAGPTAREDAAAAVAEVFPAIEIVERRYGDLAEARYPDPDRRPGLPRGGRARCAGGRLARARSRRGAGHLPCRRQGGGVRPWPRPAGPSDGGAGLAGILRRGAGLRRVAGGPGGLARLRHPADLAGGPRGRGRRFRSARPGEAALHLIPAEGRR